MPRAVWRHLPCLDLACMSRAKPLNLTGFLCLIILGYKWIALGPASQFFQGRRFA